MASEPLLSGISAELLLTTPTLLCATTWRVTCDPSDPYSGFSVCHYTGDTPDHWQACRRLLAQSLSVDQEAIVIPRQTHSTRVALIDRLPVDTTTIDDVDAVVTTLHGVVLGVNTADCLPLLLFDSTVGVIAAVHCGWRGIVGGIVENTIQAMASLGADVTSLHAIIAPHIRECCFEVGDEVAVQFSPAESDVYPNGKCHVNLSLAVANRLTALGLPASHITDSGACTRCHPDRYFSARAHGIASGRNFTFITQR